MNGNKPSRQSRLPYAEQQSRYSRQGHPSIGQGSRQQVGGAGDLDGRKDSDDENPFQRYNSLNEADDLGHVQQRRNRQNVEFKASRQSHLQQKQEKLLRSPERFENIDDRFTMQKLLGEGAYGKVYKAIDKQTNKIVALKKIKIKNPEEGIPSVELREISLLKELDHPAVVKLLDILHGDDKLYLVFEYLNSDMKCFLDKRNSQKKCLNIDQVKRVMWWILHGVLHCHQRRIMHRDLKPGNILISEDLRTIKIADFGLARSFGLPLKTYTHEVETLWYRAPEVLLGTSVYSTAIDIWALGCILFEIGHTHPMIQGQSEIDQLFKIFRLMGTPNEEVWQGFHDLEHAKKSIFPNFRVNRTESLYLQCKNYQNNKELLDLLSQMLQLEPSKRITTKGAIQHPFFSEYHNQGTQAVKQQTSLCALPMITPKKHTHFKLQKENVNPVPSGKTPEKFRLGSVSKQYNFYNNNSNSHRKSFGSNTKMSYPDPFANSRSDSIIDNDFPFRPLNKPESPEYSNSGKKAQSSSLGSHLQLGLQMQTKSEGINLITTPRNFSTSKKMKKSMHGLQGGSMLATQGVTSSHQYMVRGGGELSLGGASSNQLVRQVSIQQQNNTSKRKKRRATTNRMSSVINDENDHDRMNLRQPRGVSDDAMDNQMGDLPPNCHDVYKNQNDPNEYIKINESWQHKQSQNYIGLGLTSLGGIGTSKTTTMPALGNPQYEMPTDLLMNNKLDPPSKLSQLNEEDNDHYMAAIDEDVEQAKSYIPYNH